MYIKYFSTTTNVRPVLRFIGGINQSKQMIPHDSHVASELTALTKKGEKFKWTNSCQSAFDFEKRTLQESAAHMAKSIQMHVRSSWVLWCHRTVSHCCSYSLWQFSQDLYRCM